MRIETIRMNNFGPFRKEHELSFPGQGEGVHLLRGDNGQGKTSIQRALLWGLYGKVKDRKGQEIRPTSLINRAAVRDDIYQMAVIIHFNHESQKWTLTRRMEARTHADHQYEAGTRVSVVRDGEPVQNPEHEIRRILPDEVSRFFFFDGEMLSDYEELLDQTSRSMALLRNSIELVLGIPILRIARDDLQAVQRKFEGERARLIRRIGGASYETLIDDFQHISDRIQERETELKNLEKQMNELDVDITDSKRKLTAISSVKVLAEQRLQLERQIGQLEDSLKREQERQGTLLSTLYKTILVQSAEDIIQRLQAKHDAILEKYDEKQQLVGQEIQLKKAVDAQKCRMCGTVLNSEKLAGLKEELARVRLKIKDLTETPEPNLEYEDHVNRLTGLKSQLIRAAAFRDLDRRLNELNHDLSATRAKRDAAVAQLSGVDDDEPRRLEMEISKKTEELGRLKGLRERSKKDQLDDGQIKGELDQQINSIDKKELTTLGSRIDRVKPIAVVFDEAISTYRDERRGYVGKVASEIFRELRTKTDFSALEINQQFGLNIITKGGVTLDRAEWRSSGEEQVVALALIGALNRCAQVTAPVFMDTPFGRLDTKHGKRILGFVPKLAEQVVMFVTDREFTKQDESFLAGQIKSDHTVIFRGEDEGSDIVATKG